MLGQEDGGIEKAEEPERELREYQSSTRLEGELERYESKEGGRY